MEKNERCITPLYNFTIETDMHVTISIVIAKKVHVLGMLEELSTFLGI